MILFFAVVISFITDKKTELSVEVNEAFNLKVVYEKLGINKGIDSEVILKKFIIERYLNKNKSVKSYKSYISIINSNSSIDQTIEVNKPLKINEIKIYQKSWTLGVREIKFILNNKQYDLFDQEKTLIKTNDNLLFKISPIDVYYDKILYKWEIFDNDLNFINQGAFILNNSDYKNIYPPEKYNFKIIKEDYKLIGIYEITYSKNKLFLAIASLFFLFTIFINFWGFNIIKGIFKK